MGLLSKANLLDFSKGLAFSDFINKYSIKFFALFELVNDSYVIQSSLGFDGTSLLTSSSSKDFWNGLQLEQKKVYTFSQTDNPLLQFFSFKIKDSVESISAVRINDSKIFLVCNTPFDKNVLDDFISIDFSDTSLDVTTLNKYINKDSYIYKLEIDFQEAVETFIFSKRIKDENSVSLFSKAIVNELFNRVLYLYNYQNTGLISGAYSVKTVFLCNSKTSKDLLINHLILNFKEVLDNSAEIISINFLGNVETFTDLKEFLQEK